MSSPLPAPRFFIDESAMGLAKALAAARPDVVHPGHRRLPEVPTGTKDVDWMPVVASLDLVVVARDRRIGTKPAEVDAFRAVGLRAFWIAGKRDLSNWDSLTLMVRAWDRIEEIIETEGAGPWFYAIYDTTITRLKL